MFTQRFHSVFGRRGHMISAALLSVFLLTAARNATAIDVSTSPNWGWATIGNAGNLSLSNDNIVPGNYSDDAYNLSQYYNGVNTTYVYSATIKVTDPTQLQFYKYFDDGGYVALRKVGENDTLGETIQLINDTQWNSYVTSTDAQQFEGTYYLEVRAGYGGGGNGPEGGSFGFGIRNTYNDGPAWNEFSRMDFDAGGHLAGFSTVEGVGKRFITSNITGDTTLTGETAAANPDGNPVILTGAITAGLVIDANDTPFRINRSTATTASTGNLAVTSGTVVLSAAGGGAINVISNVYPGATLRLEVAGEQISGWINNMNGTFDLNGFNETLGHLDGNGKIINTGATRSTLSLHTGTMTFSGVIGDWDAGSNSAVNADIAVESSTWVYLTNNNHYTGGTTAKDGGVVYIHQSGSLGTGDVRLVNGGIIGTDNQGTHPHISQKVFLEGSGGFTTEYGSWITIDGQITDNGTGTNDLLIAYGQGTVTLTNNTNNYNGKTIIGSENRGGGNYATLAMGADNVLPSATTVQFNQRGGGASVLQMAGHNLTLGAAVGNGQIQNSGGNAVLTFNVTGTGVKAFNEVLGDAVWVDANVKLAKTGAGTMNVTSRIFNGTNDFDLNEGGIVVTNNGMMAAGKKVNVTGTASMTVDTTNAAWGQSFNAGLGNIRNADAPPPTSYTTTPSTVLNSRDNGQWVDNSYRAYSLLVYLSDPTQLQFMDNFDDSSYIMVTPLSDTLVPGTALDFNSSRYQGNGENYNNVTYSDNTNTLAAGYYLLDVRVGQNVGGVGPDFGGALGVGIKAGHTDYSDRLNNAGHMGGNTNYYGGDFYGLDIVNGQIQIGANEYLRASTDQIIASNFEIAGGETFTINGAGTGKVAFNGAISGGGNLKLNSDGTTFYMNAANSYGGTTDLAGKFVVSNQGAFSGSELSISGDTRMTLNLAAGQDIANNLVLVDDAKFELLETGANDGLFTGNISGTGKLVFDLDQLAASRALYEINTLDVTNLQFQILAADPSLLDGLTFDLLSAVNFNGTSNIEDYLPNLFDFSLTGDVWNYSYDAGTGMISLGFDGGNVPEPGTWALMLLGAAGVFLLRRKKA